MLIRGVIYIDAFMYVPGSVIFYTSQCAKFVVSVNDRNKGHVISLFAILNYQSWRNWAKQ